MSHWVVIPCRGPEAGKSRLTPVLTDAQRARLILSMLDRVLSAALAAAPGHVLVVTPSETVAKAARATGAEVLIETGSGLNPALEEARRELRVRSAEAMTVIAADLPDVTEDDVTALMAARGDGIALAQDRHGGGTNGLSLAIAASFPFQFGNDSRAAHIDAARRQGLAVSVLDRPGLARDIDVPADLGTTTGKTDD